MRRGQTRLTHQLLKEALHLPGEVIAVWQDPLDQMHGTFRVLLGGDDMPIVAEGLEPPFVCADKNGNIIP
jgi:hypothetical protein